MNLYVNEKHTLDNLQAPCNISNISDMQYLRSGSQNYCTKLDTDVFTNSTEKINLLETIYMSPLSRLAWKTFFKNNCKFQNMVN